MKPAPWPSEISRKDFAVLAGVTADRIGQLAKEGVLPVIGRGKFPYPVAVTAYFRHLRDAATRGHATDNNDRVKVARAREIELRIAQRERRLVPIEEAEAATSIIFGAMRSEIEGSAANITRDRELRNRIQDAHDGILKRAAERIAREVASLRSGSLGAEAVEEDDAGGVGASE